MLQPQVPWMPRDPSAVFSEMQAPLLVAMWWLAVATLGLVVIVFGPYFLPPKWGYDSAIYLWMANTSNLWEGWSFDSYVNTARFWGAVLLLMPYEVAIPVYYCAIVAIAMRAFQVFSIREPRFQLLAGAWMACASLFLSLPNKEIIALPVALWLCLASSRRAQLAATALFFAYSVFYRQYWAITFFYFACAQLALRLQVARRPALALLLMLAAFALPFLAADVLGLQPLTDARMAMNAERVDSPDAQTAFDNPFANTGFFTDVANAAISWAYMNVPLALLATAGPQHLAFLVFQLWTLWFFVAGVAALLRDARRGMEVSTPMRCAAFVIAYSLTQSMFEPDFGSFLRHEVLCIIPMLVVALYRAHAARPAPVRVRRRSADPDADRVEADVP